MMKMMATWAIALIWCVLGVMIDGSPSQLPTGKVIELSHETFDEQMNKGSSWLVLIHSPRCPHCIRMMPAYEEAAMILKDHNIYVGSIDAFNQASLAQRFPVNGFPTLYSVHGSDVREYNGKSRSASALVEFAIKGWKEEQSLSLFSNPFGPVGKVKAGLVTAGLSMKKAYTYLRTDMKLSLASTLMLLGFAALVATLLVIVIAIWLFTPPPAAENALNRPPAVGNPAQQQPQQQQAHDHQE